MRRFHWYPLILMLLVPGTSSALELRWSNGLTELSFTSATRCTLAVQADSAEARLPAEWSLLWVADSASIQFVATDSIEACLLDEAQVARIDGPATVADSAANQITAHFCSDETIATVAQQVVDLPAGGRGKLKVIALDPVSEAIVESNEVTYNGGIDGGYPSAALAASSSHASSQFVVHAAGTGLSEVVEVIAQAPDSLWSLPLQITEQSDSTLTAVAEVVASMPASVLRLTSQSGAVAVAPLPADGQREGIDPDFEVLAESCRCTTATTSIPIRTCTRRTSRSSTRSPRTRFAGSSICSTSAITRTCPLARPPDRSATPGRAISGTGRRNGDSTAWGTYATEHLRVGRVDFLATFDGAGILVSRMLWNGTDFTLIQPSVTAVGGGRSEPESRVALRVAEAAPGAGRLSFEIDLPTRERVRLGIYDVAGRRVRSLIDDQVPAGTIRVQWDGKDQAGNAARTGMYFARLSGEFGSRVVRAAFVR